MNVRKRVHLIDPERGNGDFTACGLRRYTLHTDVLPAVTCWNCKATTAARNLREATR